MKASDDKRSPIKDKPLRYPGQYLDKEIKLIQLERVRNVAFFSIILTVAVFELLHAYAGMSPQPIFAGLLLLASGIYLYYLDTKLREKRDNYEQGSQGERAVGDILDKLKQEGCRVFHDVVINGANYNIDHVILSTHGIFAVETKTHSKPRGGKVSSNGKVVFISGKNPDGKPIDQAINNAKSLRRYLNEKTGRDFHVKAVLVYPGWFVKDYTDSRIWILNPKVLQIKINREPETISRTDYDKAELYLSNAAK